eukprot:scaffold1535_cov382-Prasinococcus_capsulatus_cf.AAC.35
MDARMQGAGGGVAGDEADTTVAYDGLVDRSWLWRGRCAPSTLEARVGLEGVLMGRLDGAMGPRRGGKRLHARRLG